MKKVYEKPIIEIEEFEVEDIALFGSSSGVASELPYDNIK